MTHINRPFIVFAGIVALACSDATAPAGGVLQVTVTTNAVDIDADADGYSIVVDGAAGQAIAPSASLATFALTAGRHQVRLDGLAPNCSVVGIAERTVEVASGQTTTASYQVNCVANLGTVRITTITTGPNELSNYVATLPGPGAVSIALNSTSTFSNVRAGYVHLAFSNLPANCVLDGGPLRTLNVAFGVSTDIALTIRCLRAPQDRLIAYSTGKDDRSTIDVVNENGTGERRLAALAYEKEPAWSPDGRKIAFTSGRDSNYEIYVMNADGTNPVRLTTTLATDYRAAWSPDGKHIAFTSERDGNPEIYVMNADGSDPKRLTFNPGYDNSADWSPDGGKIVFERGPGKVWDGTAIAVMHADGTNSRDLTAIKVTTLGNHQPSWSPDGEKIAFIWGDFTGYFGRIRVMNPDGNAMVEIKTDFSAVDPTWDA